MERTELTAKQRSYIALAMADRLEFTAIGLEKVGLKKEAEISRKKAKEIRSAHP